MKAPLFRNQPGAFQRGRGHAVGNKPGGPAGGVKEILPDVFRQDNDLIGKPHRHALAQMDEFGGNAPIPLFPLPVQAMDGDNDPLAEQFGQPAEKGGALRVDVHHIVAAESAAHRGKKGGNHSGEALAFQRGYRHQPDAPVDTSRRQLVFRAADMVARPVIAGHAVSQRRHPRAQRLHHHFHAALVGGDALMAQHGNFQLFRCGFHGVFPPESYRRIWANSGRS